MHHVETTGAPARLAGAGSTPDKAPGAWGGQLLKTLFQSVAFFSIWIGHSALSFPQFSFHALRIGQLDTIAMAGAFGEGIAYTVVPWILLAPVIHRMKQGSFRGTTMASLLIACGIGLGLRILAHML